MVGKEIICQEVVAVGKEWQEVLRKTSALKNVHTIALYPSLHWSLAGNEGNRGMNVRNAGELHGDN